MKSRHIVVFSLFVFCMFVFLLCEAKQTQSARKIETMGEEKMEAEVAFSKEADDYIVKEMEKEPPTWKEHPGKKLEGRLIALKKQLEGTSSDPARIMVRLGARIESDSGEMNIISGQDIFKLFEKYSKRELKFEIRHVFVEKIAKEKYIWVDGKKEPVDMMAHVMFRLHFNEIQEEKVKNDSFDGSYASPHRHVCEW